MKRWWNIRVQLRPEHSPPVSEEPLSLDEAPSMEYKDVSLHVDVAGKTAEIQLGVDTDRERAIVVFGGLRKVPKSQLSIRPKFDTRLSGNARDSMEELSRSLSNDD